METVVLNNGVEMPLLGLGVFQLTDLQECENIVVEALRVGYRLLDTAASYGNEAAVGNAIRKSGVPRQELFITTKLWVADAGYEKTKKAFERSMQRLGLDYLDLYLIHLPIGDVYGAWRAMEELYQAGRIRAIGVCNFPDDRLMDLLLHNEVPPAVNQLETHPFHQRLDTQQFLADNQVQLEAWGPFAEGKNDIFHHEQLRTLGAKYQKSVAQVVLRWFVQRRIVAILKSARPERLTENFDVFDFELSAEDMALVAALDTQTSIFPDPRTPQTVLALSTAKRDT